MNNKKITFFIGSIEEGGAERVVSYLTTYFVDNGVDVSLVTYYDRKLFYSIDNRIEVKSVCRETKNGSILKNVKWLRRYIVQNSSVVVSFLAPFNMLVLLATRGLHVPVVVADRNDPHFVPHNFFIRHARNLLYRMTDGAVFQTKHNQAYFSKCVQKKSCIIYNPIDLGDRVGKGGQTPKEKLIVSVCRLMPQKNLSMLIRVFSELHNDYPDYRLVIYGEGPERTELERLVETLNMKNTIMLPGSEQNVFDKICPACLFVLPSNYEGMPNALAEAMCLGLPCISTAVSGATDLIYNEKNGILVDINNSDQMKKAIVSVLNDKDYAAELGKNATDLNKVLDKSVIAKQWLEYVLSFCYPKK